MPLEAELFAVEFYIYVDGLLLNIYIYISSVSFRILT